jgi:hypothetical protein
MCCPTNRFVDNSIYYRRRRLSFGSGPKFSPGCHKNVQCQRKIPKNKQFSQYDNVMRTTYLSASRLFVVRRRRKAGTSATTAPGWSSVRVARLLSLSGNVYAKLQLWKRSDNTPALLLSPPPPTLPSQTFIETTGCLPPMEYVICGVTLSHCHTFTLSHSHTVTPTSFILDGKEKFIKKYTWIFLFLANRDGIALGWRGDCRAWFFNDSL